MVVDLVPAKMPLHQHGVMCLLKHVERSLKIQKIEGSNIQFPVYNGKNVVAKYISSIR